MPRTRFIAFLGLFVFSLIALGGCAKHADLLVVDDHGQPIEGATVTAISLSMNGPTTTTDAKGQANIPKNIQGTKWVQVSKPGYATPFQIDVDQDKPIRVVMRPAEEGNGLQIMTPFAPG